MANPNISRIFGSAGFLKIRLWCLFEYDDELWAALCVEMLTWVWRTARRCMMTNPRASPTATRSSMPCSFLPHFTSWWHWHTGTSKSCKRFFWFVITIFMLYGIFWLCCWWKYIHIRLLMFGSQVLDYTYAVHTFIYMHTQKMKFSLA